MRLTARHIESKGVGYNTGYTTVEGFFGGFISDMKGLPFLDLRGHVFNDGKLAANAGIGIRGLIGCRIYGVNAYYDYRDTRKSHYNQASAGLETLGERWDFRINGYLPVGDKKSHPYYPKFHSFTGHKMLISRKYEFAMKGADAELGFHFCRSHNWEMYAAAGPYYFIGPIGRPAWGGKARINAKWKDLIVVELSNTYDRVFHDNVQGQISFNLPFGPRPKVQKRDSNCFDSCKFINTISDRFVQPVVRDEIIVVDARRKTSVAKDPGTGKPFNFIFVDNTSSSAGTFESPYPSLAAAETNSTTTDVIYVFPGDGTTKNMDLGIALKDSQRLLGSGTAHPIPTTAGTVTIPPLTSSMPVIQNIGGDTVTLANNNIIAGMYILHGNGGTGDGINQPTSGFNVGIYNNTIQTITTGASLSGINLTNVTGNVDIVGNHFNQGVSSGFASNTSISITSSDLQKANHSIKNNQALDDVGININLTDCSNFNFDISGNNFTSSFEILTATIDTSTQAMTNSISIDNNYCITPNVNAIVMHFGGASLNSAPVTNVSLTNNTIISQGTSRSGSAPIVLSGNSQTALSYINNQIISAQNAIFINGGVTSKVSLNIENNSLTGDNSDTIAFNVLSSNYFNANITNNTINNTNLNSLINFETINNGTNSFVISNNTMSNGINGIVYTSNAGNNTFTITNNNFSNQLNNSISVSASGTNTFEIAGNTFSAMLDQAVFATNSDGANMCISFINNVATPIAPLGSAPDVAYVFKQQSGAGPSAFILDARKNIGEIDIIGTVFSGTCQ